jgi:hypothetical protein
VRRLFQGFAEQGHQIVSSKELPMHVVERIQTGRSGQGKCTNYLSVKRTRGKDETKKAIEVGRG